MAFLRSVDWVAFVGCMAGLCGLIGLGERLRRWGWSSTTIRRLLHASVGLVVAGTPLMFLSPASVYLLSALFVVINAIGRRQHWWPAMDAGRTDSWGTVLMPLAVIPAVAATWSVDVGRVFILQLAFVVLALADPLASWSGAAFGETNWVGAATVVGSVVFWGVTLVVTGTALFGGVGWSIERSAVGALSVATVATATEAISRHGWDNLFVVLGVVVLLVHLHENPGIEGQIGVGLVLGAAFGIGAYGTGALNRSGAVGGGLFAFSLVALGGRTWALPGFVFFAGASILSFTNAAAGTDTFQNAPGNVRETREGPERTLRQVLANGGIAWLLFTIHLVLPPAATQVQASCYVGFLGALAAAAADTWATETGTLSSKRPWSLRTGTSVEVGTSGAVSGTGTVGALLGAASVAGAAVVGGGGIDSIGWGAAVGITGAGLIGMAVDSLAGAFLQARYRESSTGRLVERPPENEAAPVRGWRGIDNAVVNGLGTTAGALAGVLFL